MLRLGDAALASKRLLVNWTQHLYRSGEKLPTAGYFNFCTFWFAQQWFPYCFTLWLPETFHSMRQCQSALDLCLQSPVKQEVVWAEIMTSSSCHLVLLLKPDRVQKKNRGRRGVKPSKRQFMLLPSKPPCSLQSWNKQTLILSNSWSRIAKTWNSRKNRWMPRRAFCLRQHFDQLWLRWNPSWFSIIILLLTYIVSAQRACLVSG